MIIASLTHVDGSPYLREGSRSAGLKHLPTTLEFLTLLVDQGPTARILALLTFRPDFSLPWTGRSHLTQVSLSRLPRRQAAEMTNRVAHSKMLPAEVVEQVVAKTDG